MHYPQTDSEVFTFTEDINTVCYYTQKRLRKYLEYSGSNHKWKQLENNTLLTFSDFFFFWYQLLNVWLYSNWYQKKKKKITKSAYVVNLEISKFLYYAMQTLLDNIESERKMWF